MHFILFYNFDLFYGFVVVVSVLFYDFLFCFRTSLNVAEVSSVKFS